MKHILAILFLATAQFASAEYNGWYVDFTIKTKSNETIYGHLYVASAYFDKDSIQDEAYVLKRFNHLDNKGGNDSLDFFKNRITYNYIPLGSEENAVIYTLVNQDKLAFVDIDHITITQMIDYWYLSNIATSHTLADTIWMNKPPTQMLLADGYLCSWEIFVHKRTAETDQIIAELQASQEMYKKIIKKLEDEEEYNGSEAYRDAKEEMSKYEDSIDEITDEILSKLKGQKVVIVSFCSC